jgi:hypothetical protein
MELVSYQIDRDDTLTGVGDGWRDFAMSNGAPYLADHVLGRNLFEFIIDATTRHIYRDLLAGVRAGREVSFDYRCDSPSLRRFMRMTMTARPQQGVAFRSLTVRTEPRVPATPDLGATPTGNPLLVVCSWCKRVSVQDEWLEMEAVIERLGLFTADAPPALTHGACPACYERIMAALDVA